MTNYSNLYHGLNGSFIEQAEIKSLAHYQVGGKIDLLAYPATIEECTEFIRRCNAGNIPIFAFGKGSNLLISDEGFRGVFLCFDQFASKIELDEDGAGFVGASVVLWDLVQHTIEHGYGDMTNMSWIPGTVGGALFMNAGAFGTEIEEFVTYVHVLHRDGTFEKLTYEACGFGYRNSLLQDKFILGGEFCFHKKDKLKMKENSEDIIRRRQSKQPLDFPSCGSVFKRPPGLYAGTLIEECGLKGFSIGGAEVSEKHANFILNKNATAQDVYSVIKHVQKVVFEQKKVQLEREVKFVGFKEKI